MASLGFSKLSFQTFPEEFYLFVFNWFLRENDLNFSCSWVAQEVHLEPVLVCLLKSLTSFLSYWGNASLLLLLKKSKTWVIAQPRLSPVLSICLCSVLLLISFLPVSKSFWFKWYISTFKYLFVCFCVCVRYVPKFSCLKTILIVSEFLTWAVL